MTGRFWLDWAILALSLFNMILLLWLGMTVLLNANRRHWGVWLMGGGLLLGAVFFLSHTAILGQEATLNLDGVEFWWRAGWFPVTVSPIAWYVAVLWVSGFWAAPQSNLHRRHRPWLWIMAVWLLGLMALLLVGNPIPAYAQLIGFELSEALMVGNTPLLFLLFPVWTVTCILLSIDVLRRPADVENPFTQTARQRAWPWLLATAVTLLAATLVVTYFVGSVVTAVAAGELRAIPMGQVAAYDLALSVLIGLALLLLGQAVVSYEIFTGRALPRRSFVRHWRLAILLAGGYAAIVGWTLTFQLRPIYSLLLATLLMTFFFALYSWRSFWDREQVVARLRPLVQNQGDAANPLHTGASASRLLAVLCRDLLRTAHGQIRPLGSMASLVTAPLCYPEEIRSNLPDSLDPRSIAVDAGMTLLDGARFAPYAWAISLWDERERIGVLLLGEKVDGGLYSQEEMETAQAAGERILHMLASEEMVSRLIEIQRRRTVEQRVMDLRTRRALHDEILPTLHLAVLQLSGVDRGQPLIAETLGALSDVHRQIANLLTSTQATPMHSPDPCELVSALHALVEGEFAHAFDQIEWRGPGGEAQRAGAESEPIHIDPMIGEVILGAVHEATRNAAAHGRGERADQPLSLRIGVGVQGGRGGELILTIADNGVGLAGAAPSAGGSGSGLALHRTLLAIVGGTLTVAPSLGGGAQVTITMPMA